MFTLKCEFCGYEQNVKKKIDKYTYYELTHCKHLWCPCNKCKEQHPRPRNFTNDEVMHACAALCERHTLHCAVPYYKTSGKRTVL